MRCGLIAVLSMLLLGAGEYSAPQTQGQSGAARWFGDVMLIDQDGKRVRLYEDMMERQIVVVNAFFTSCHAACPLVMGTLSHLQAQLGRAG